MTIACYLEPTKPKADHWMQAFATGCGGRVVLDGKRADWATDHVVMGNWPVAGTIIADSKLDQVPYWYLDAGYIQTIKSQRIERNRFWPVLSGSHSLDRALSMGVEIKPWRRSGSHVLVCLHSQKFGRPWGIDPVEWNHTIEARVRAMTDRPIIIRRKPINPAQKLVAGPVELLFEDAWCVVCHSSTVGVKAALAGIPVFCEATCAAAPVGRTDWNIEEAVCPDREQWIADLAWRQFSLEEMKSGMAWRHMRTERCN